MRALIFDTETTGTFDKDLPVNHPSQPYIVTLSAILTDESQEDIVTIDVMIKPDGWSVPTSAAAVHGIPTEKAEKHGIPIQTAARLFIDLSKQADWIVGHNVNFDIDMFRRYSTTPNEIFLDAERYTIFDTMEACRNYMRMEASDKQKWAHQKWPAKVPEFKSPKLEEAYKFFFQEEMVGAHDSLNDVKATKKVFFEELELKLHRDGILIR